MTDYNKLTLKQFADLARNSSNELGSMSDGLMCDYETGKYFSVSDEDTALFLASAREIVLELVKRLAALEPSQPVAPVEINKGVQSALTKDFVWPPPADVCRCEEGFEGEALDWNCKRCGGSRF